MIWQTAKGMIIGVLSLVVIIAVVVGLWLGGVFASPAVGRANAYKEKHSSSNWTSAQAQFVRDYEDVIKFNRQIAEAQLTADQYDKAHPANPNPMPGDPVEEHRSQLADDLAGLEQQCGNTVADYNTAAGAYLSRDFRDSNLPDRLGTDNCTPAAITTTVPTDLPTTGN
jgi:hypothetical protein